MSDVTQTDKLNKSAKILHQHYLREVEEAADRLAEYIGQVQKENGIEKITDQVFLINQIEGVIEQTIGLTEYVMTDTGPLEALIYSGHAEYVLDVSLSDLEKGDLTIIEAVRHAAYVAMEKDVLQKLSQDYPQKAECIEPVISKLRKER